MPLMATFAPSGSGKTYTNRTDDGAGECILYVCVGSGNSDINLKMLVYFIQTRLATPRVFNTLGYPTSIVVSFLLPSYVCVATA